MTPESIFVQALETDDRTAFLNRVCADNPILRKEVESLLAAHDASNPLDRPIDLGRTGAYISTGESASVGDRVGGYKLLERIGEGGMGEVWVAEQSEPIRRRVALKLIKPGMDSRSVLARFEAERQALALMDHPNIAKVLDAGTTTDGRPFFVMELVKGTPITEFCDARKLTPRERLELFIPVCQAIQHAHMKGIIHRDIKPSNVMVALHDEKPVPKVIDFGVAKAIGQQLTDKTIYTGFGALVGTPAYMAPEQATFNQLDIDTRADVYALGVLLYELLTGNPPIEPERMRKAALDEVLRLVREEEPPRPSQRLSTSSARASIAESRKTEPLKLSRMMRGEIDWIVMKALEKDRVRRYESANGLAKDVQRYLTDEPIEARPPSTWYRLGKFYRRNRIAVLGIIAFATVLITTTAVSIFLAVWAWQAERAAVRSHAHATGTLKFVHDEILTPSDVVHDYTGLDPDITMRTVLDRATSRLDGRFQNLPQVEAGLRRTLGLAYMSLGQMDPARLHLQRSLELCEREFGSEYQTTLLIRKELGMVYVLSHDDINAEQTLVPVAGIDRPGWENDPIRRAAASMLVGVYQRQDRLPEAEEMARRVIVAKRSTSGPTDPSTLRSLENLGEILITQNRMTEAETVCREVLAGYQQSLGDDHPKTVRAKQQLELVLQKKP